MAEPTTDMPGAHPSDDDSAAELALGLLDGPERAAAMRRVLAEPGFAAEVEWWRLQFAALFDLWPEADASPEIAERIAASVEGVSVVNTAPRRFPWPAVAALTSAIAACLLLFVMVRPAPPAPAPVSQAVPVARATSLLVAMLGTTAPVAAVYDPALGQLRVAAAPGVPSAKVAELWVIGGDGVPHALGLLGAQPTALSPPPPDRARIAAGTTLAISVEPTGGSPTGLPTGPVIATGVVARV